MRVTTIRTQGDTCRSPGIYTEHEVLGRLLGSSGYRMSGHSSLQAQGKQQQARSSSRLRLMYFCRVGHAGEAEQYFCKCISV